MGGPYIETFYGEGEERNGVVGRGEVGPWERFGWFGF